mmetsp:Transcript_10041/g.25066  ORF Transcript_10041/g.25066 Transcript_10041/m.25066 type:complete len:216 (+) Transcript_10041:536-1183(+)
MQVMQTQRRAAHPNGRKTSPALCATTCCTSVCACCPACTIFVHTACRAGAPPLRPAATSLDALHAASPQRTSAPTMPSAALWESSYRRTQRRSSPTLSGRSLTRRSRSRGLSWKDPGRCSPTTLMTTTLLKWTRRCLRMRGAVPARRLTITITSVPPVRSTTTATLATPPSHCKQATSLWSAPNATTSSATSTGTVPATRMPYTSSVTTAPTRAT